MKNELFNTMMISMLLKVAEDFKPRELNYAHKSVNPKFAYGDFFSFDLSELERIYAMDKDHIKFYNVHPTFLSADRIAFKTDIDRKNTYFVLASLELRKTTMVVFSRGRDTFIVVYDNRAPKFMNIASQSEIKSDLLYIAERFGFKSGLKNLMDMSNIEKCSPIPLSFEDLDYYDGAKWLYDGYGNVIFYEGNWADATGSDAVVMKQIRELSQQQDDFLSGLISSGMDDFFESLKRLLDDTDDEK